MRAQIAPQEHAAWLVARTGVALTPDCRVIEVVDAEGQIRGMAVFDAWTPNAVQVHMAVDAPIAWRALLKTSAEYIFRDGGRSVVFGLTPAFNERALKTAHRVGFVQTYAIRDGWSIGVDLLVHELRRESCRWLKETPNEWQLPAAR